MYQLILLALSIVSSHAWAQPNLKISVVPTNPIVIDAPLTFNKGSVTYSLAAPWYRLQVMIDNQTLDTVTITAVKVVTKSDTDQISKTDFTPDQFSFPVDCGNAGSLPVVFENLGVFGPKTTGYLKLTYAGTFSPECKMPMSYTDEPILYVVGIPRNSLNQTYVYSAQITVEGFRGAPPNAMTNFSKTLTIQPQ